MKISGSGSIRSNATRRAGRKGGDGGATFRVESGGGAEAAAQTGAASSVAGVGSLLALQEVPDALEQRRQAVLRSTDILDELQQLRMGLLTGSVPRQRLQRLMLAQDVGSAIKGIVRGDFYWGTGRAALDKAGRMKSTGSYYILVPKALIPAS